MSSEEVGCGRTGPPAGSYWSGYDLLWGLGEPEPSRRTTLDRPTIVSAAIELADRGGLAVVTMRSVASALGTAPMSLYRHVPDKEALVSMMVDAAVAGSSQRRREPGPDGWRGRLRLVAGSTWRLCRRHPWYPEASLVRPPITPSGLAGFEWALASFDGMPLDIGTKAQFVGAVYAAVVSAALRTATEEAARRRALEEADRGGSGTAEADLHAEGARFIRRVMSSGEFPRVSAFIVEAEHLDAEGQMWSGVELILDGIAARLAAAGCPTAPPTC